MNILRPCKETEVLMVMQSIVQYLPTKVDGSVDVVVVSAAMASPVMQPSSVPLVNTNV